MKYITKIENFKFNDKLNNTFESQRYRSKTTDLKIYDFNVDELNHLSEYVNLKSFNCSGNDLKSLPELPKSLTILICNDNDLKSLPELPESIIYLYCNNNDLKSLPELPKSLTHLKCFNNDLKSLPELPKILKVLDCSGNDLKSLPELPKSLEYFYCYETGLPFEDLNGYKKWYDDNKYLIETEGLEYAYQLYNQIEKYNL